MCKSDYVYMFDFDCEGNFWQYFEIVKGDVVSDLLVRFYDYDLKNWFIWM